MKGNVMDLVNLNELTGVRIRGCVHMARNKGMEYWFNLMVMNMKGIFNMANSMVNMFAHMLMVPLINVSFKTVKF
jgi:hypothetical protein